MQKVNIFLSYEKDVESVKDEISNFVRSLNNNYVDKGIVFEMHTPYDTKDFKELIDSSDLFIMILMNNLENKELFDEALKHFYKNNNPKVIPYIKQNTNYSKSIKEFMDYLGNDLGHFYKTFTHIDSLKLGIITQLQAYGFNNIVVSKGQIVLEGKPILALDNIDMFVNNEDIQRLQKEYDALETEYIDIKAKYADDKKAYQDEYDKITNKRDVIKENINCLENMFLEFTKTISYKKASHRMIKAMDLFYAGKINAADALLNEDEIYAEIEENKKKNNIEALNINASELLLKTRIPLFKQSNDKTLKYYHTLFDLVLYNNDICPESPIYYSKYLISLGRYEESIRIFDNVIKEPLLNKISYNDYLKYLTLSLELDAYLNDEDGAEKTAQKALQSIEQAINSKTISEFEALINKMIIHNCMGKTYYELTKFEVAKKEFLEARELGKKIWEEYNERLTGQNLFEYCQNETLIYKYLNKIGPEVYTSDILTFLKIRNETLYMKKFPEGGTLYGGNYFLNYINIAVCNAALNMRSRKYEEALKWLDDHFDYYVAMYKEDKTLEPYYLKTLCLYRLARYDEALKTGDETLKIIIRLLKKDSKKYFFNALAICNILNWCGERLGNKKVCRQYKKEYTKLKFSWKSIFAWSTNRKVKGTHSFLYGKLNKELEL